MGPSSLPRSNIISTSSASAGTASIFTVLTGSLLASDSEFTASSSFAVTLLFSFASSKPSTSENFTSASPAPVSKSCPAISSMSSSLVFAVRFLRCISTTSTKMSRAMPNSRNLLLAVSIRITSSVRLDDELDNSAASASAAS